MNRTAAVFSRYKIVFVFSFDRYKAKSPGIAQKDAVQKMALRFGIFSLFGHLYFAFVDQRIQHFCQLASLAFGHPQNHRHFFCLHRDVQFVADKGIDHFLSVFQ